MAKTEYDILKEVKIGLAKYPMNVVKYVKRFYQKEVDNDSFLPYRIKQMVRGGTRTPYGI